MKISTAVIEGVEHIVEISDESSSGILHKITSVNERRRASTNGIGFYLKERREDFILALFDLLIKHPIDASSHLLPSAWRSTGTEELSKYVASIDVSDPAQVHSIVLYSTGWSKRLSTNTKLVREHLKRYDEELKTHRDRNLLFWDVRLAQWGIESWKKLYALNVHSLTTPVIKRCEDPEYLDFALIASKISSWGLSSEKTKVRDFTGSLQSNTDWLDLPVHHKEFREYVLDLIVGDYRKIAKKIPVSTSSDGAIAMADEILGRTKKVDTVEKAVETYIAVAVAAAKISNQDYWTYLNDFYLRRHSSSANLLAVAKGYAETFSPRTMPKESIQLMNEVLFQNERGRWCAAGRQSDHIAGRLLELTGSPRKAWDVILGAYSSGKVLDFSKWERFLNEWENFKDMPSDLAVYLL